MTRRLHPALNLLAATLALAAALPAAHAQAAVNHPAAWGAAVPAADQARLATGATVGHPASPTVRAGHANAEHPAVLLADEPVRVDTNTFIVQPPASTRWTLGPAGNAPLAVAALR